jgi:biotin transport system substrate-specific component
MLQYQKSKLTKLFFCFALSWFYALCSQITIPLPFNIVPISIQSLIFFSCSIILGKPAVYAYILTLIQTALGAPFFSGFEGGLTKLLGPTGGYIFGFACAMIFLALIKNYKPHSYITTFLKVTIAQIILYTIGTLQLSYFVSRETIFLLGLYPFIFSAILKMGIITYVATKKN